MTDSKGSLQIWNEWLERDDRSWLKALAERKWSAVECHKSLGLMLESIVTSLHFSCHSRWGLQPSEDRLPKITFEFLEWMKSSGEWLHIEKTWGASQNGPWSLPLSLSRSYVRFRETSLSDKNMTRSESSARAFLELPAPSELGHHLTDTIMNAFGSLTQQLPAHLRLSYQLHLEGLLENEIASITAQPIKEVHQHILEAKGFFTGSQIGAQVAQQRKKVS